MHLRSQLPMEFLSVVYKNLLRKAHLEIDFKINRIQAINDINKLCYFHKNLTKDADLMA